MKLLIASDIHGSARYCRALIERIAAEEPDRVILLGDLLYHGPRNDLPEKYAPKQVIEMLNGLETPVLCVRGNCEAEVDQMVLDFPVLAEIALLLLGNRLVFATHGHHACESAPPAMERGGILLCGHTHVPAWTAHEEFWYLNPGSVSIPKNGSRHSYMMWEDGVFRWKDVVSGEEYHSLTLL